MSHDIDFTSGSTYLAGIKSLRLALSKGGKTIADAKQHDQALILDLKIGKKTVLETLIQKSDLYLLGFRGPGKDTWNVFKGHTALVKDNAGSVEKTQDKVRKTEKSNYKCANCNELTGVGCNYNDLGAFGNATSLWGQDITKALQSLASYTGKGSEVDKGAAVVMIFVISEAIRFDSISQAVVGALDGEASLDLDNFKDKVTNWDKAASTDIDVLVRKS